jgi:hypothetical protein
LSPAERNSSIALTTSAGMVTVIAVMLAVSFKAKPAESGGRGSNFSLYQPSRLDELANVH